MTTFSNCEVHIWKVWQMFCFHILMWLGSEMDMEEDDIDDRLDAMMFVCLRQLMTWRYSVPQTQRTQQLNQFEEDLCEDGIPFLNKSEFHHKYKMKRESFKELVQMVKDHPIFNCSRYGRRWKQAPPLCTKSWYSYGT